MRTRRLLALAVLLAGPACNDTTKHEGGTAGDAAPVDATQHSVADAAPPDASPADAAVNLLDVGHPAWDMGAPDAAPVTADAAPVTADAAPPGPDQGPNPDRDPLCSAADAPGVQQPAIDLGARCRARRGPLRIRDLRDRRCPDYEDLPTRLPGTDVTLDEVVVTGLYGTKFSVQDPEGGAWSGLWVFNQHHTAMDNVQVGTHIRLQGQILEFYGQTELVPDQNGGIRVVRQGPAADPLYVADPSRIADGGDLTDALQMVLLEVRDVHVLTTAPDCPMDQGMFEVTGQLRVGDTAPYAYMPARGDALRRIDGPLYYAFNHNRLIPRGDADLDAIYCGGRADKCVDAECPVPADAPESGRLVITELQVNPNGDDSLGEYVEIFNPGHDPIDVTGWTVQDCMADTARLDGTIRSGAYHVIAASQDPRDNGGVDADGGFGTLFLPNGSGNVLLFDDQNQLVDQVRYTPDAPWPHRNSGEALELRDPSSDNRDGANWTVGTHSYGDGGKGTPGGPYRR